MRCRKSFSLIELMVTVAVLSVGLTAVLRSFFSVAGALNHAQNEIAVVQFLDTRMADLQETILNGEEFPEENLAGDVVLNGKDFHWKLNFFPLSLNDENMENMREVKLTVSWKEAGINKEEKLVSYLESKR